MHLEGHLTEASKASEQLRGALVAVAGAAKTASRTGRTGSPPAGPASKGCAVQLL
jgi:hypothetical protein